MHTCPPATEPIPENHTTAPRIERRCAWCGKTLGYAPGFGTSGISHGICEQCLTTMARQHGFHSLANRYSPTLSLA